MTTRRPAGTGAANKVWLFAAIAVMLAAYMAYALMLASCQDDWCFVFPGQRVAATNDYGTCVARGFPVDEGPPRTCRAGDKAFADPSEALAQEHAAFDEGPYDEAAPGDLIPPDLFEGYEEALASGLNEVIDVRDGETVIVDVAGIQVSVRLIGVDAPGADECGGQASTERLRVLLVGKKVRLGSDPALAYEEADGRTPRYVELGDGRTANEVMLAEGLAGERAEDGPYQRRDVHLRAEAAAREAGMGIWGPGACDE